MDCACLINNETKAATTSIFTGLKYIDDLPKYILLQNMYSNLF